MFAIVVVVYLFYWREILILKVFCALICNIGIRNTVSCISNFFVLIVVLNVKANNGNWFYWLIKADRWSIR